MRSAALAFALLALTACQPSPSEQTLITPEGYGAMRIGMPLAEAQRISGQPLNEPGIEDYPGACNEQIYRAPDGQQFWLMFEEDVITSITAGEDAHRARTAENVGVGSTDAEIRAAYPNAIEEPAKYNPPPAHDLIVWTVPERSGLRFELSEQGIVTRVHAGGASILYVEGCA